MMVLNKKCIIDLRLIPEKEYQSSNSILYAKDVENKQIYLLEFQELSNENLTSFLKSIKSFQPNKEYLTFYLLTRVLHHRSFISYMLKPYGIEIHEKQYICLSSEKNILKFSRNIQGDLRLEVIAEEDKKVHEKPVLVNPKKNNGLDSKSLVLIGSSTGGTEVVKDLLRDLPKNFPPIIIVQHMPSEFTALYAERLSLQCGRKTIEVTEEVEAKNGEAYLASGGSHLKVKVRNGKVFVYPDDSAPVNRFKPSVSVMFKSACDEKLSHKIVAIMLTGMGRDGVLEMKELRDKGALCLAQNEETCVVFGMPKAAIDIGAVDFVMSPKAMTAKLSDIKIKKIEV